MAFKPDAQTAIEMSIAQIQKEVTFLTKSLGDEFKVDLSYKLQRPEEGDDKPLQLSMILLVESAEK